jgi:hypothetical protein
MTRKSKVTVTAYLLCLLRLLTLQPTQAIAHKGSNQMSLLPTSRVCFDRLCQTDKLFLGQPN